ncbi:MAG: alpha/beta hydrolase [Anaerolineales bacterium]|nr:alpha/beta hydrolase [Anaerolineales bacterium]
MAHKLLEVEIHPELRLFAKRLPAFTFSARNLWLLRLLLSLPRLGRPPADIHIENRFIPSADSKAKLRLRIYQPKLQTARAPVLLWMHGGGLVLGKPEIDEPNCIELVRALGLVIVSVDYRVAPEHPFPTPLEDCYTALKWVAEQAVELNVDAARLAIGGESAGGGLAASLAHLAHDRGEVKPIFQLLVYPMLDDRSAARADFAHDDFLVWNQTSNRFGWEAYLRAQPGAAQLPAYAVPARRENLSGLPPAWLGVGTLDMFHDECVAYAQRLQAAGVACECYVVPGAFHGFDTFAPQSQVVRAFMQAQVDALKQGLF